MSRTFLGLAVAALVCSHVFGQSPDSAPCGADSDCASGTCRMTCCAAAFVGCAICSSDATQTDCALPTITRLCLDSNVGYAYVSALKFGPTGTEHTITDAPTNCGCINPNTISCGSVTIPAGTGAELRFALTVGASSTSTELRTVTSSSDLKPMFYADPCTLDEGYDMPFGCTCVGTTLVSCAGFGGFDLWLSHIGITAIADHAFDGLSGLSGIVDLSGNAITSISAHTLSGLTNVYTLDLNNNKITAIADHAFADLGNLHELDLQYNALATISGDTFSGLGHVRNLYLHNNKIASIADNAYSRVGRHLFELDLQYSLLDVTVRRLSAAEVEIAPTVNAKRSSAPEPAGMDTEPQEILLGSVQRQFVGASVIAFSVPVGPNVSADTYAEPTFASTHRFSP
jgi:hypothetical protein